MIVYREDVVKEKQNLHYEISYVAKVQNWAKNIVSSKRAQERGQRQIVRLLAALELRAEGQTGVKIPWLALEGLAILALAGSGSREVVLPPDVRVSIKGKHLKVYVRGQAAVFRLPVEANNNKENANKENANKENNNKKK